MAEVTEADREAANACFDFIDPAEQADAVKRTASLFAAHREAAEKASDQAVVDWLRDAVPYDFDVEGGMYFRMIAKALAQSIERDDHRKGPVQ